MPEKEKTVIEREVSLFGPGTYEFSSLKLIKKRGGAEEELYSPFVNYRQAPVTVEPVGTSRWDWGSGAEERT